MSKDIIQNVQNDEVTDVAVVNAVVSEETSVVKKQSSMLELYAQKRIDEIQKLNPGFNLGFLNVFTRLKTNSKGQFCYNLGGEDFVLSDCINTRMIAGEPVFQLWGAKDTEDEGNLICYSKNHEVSANGDVCMQCPYGHLDPSSVYFGKCSIRFAMILSILEAGEDASEVYNINLPSTATYAFADYVKFLSKKFKKGVQDVVTTIFTEEEKGKKDPTQRYNAIKFKFAKPIE